MFKLYKDDKPQKHFLKLDGFIKGWLEFILKP